VRFAQSRVVCLFTVACVLAAAPALAQDDATAGSPAAGEPATADAAGASAATAAPSADRIELEDGSVVLGKIQTMVGGKLVVVTAFGGEVTIDWSQVRSVATAGKHRFVLANESAIVGTSTAAGDGKLRVSDSGAGVDGSHTVGVAQVTAINPPPVKAVTYKGSANLGVNISDGNTQTKSGYLGIDFEMRSARQRFTAGAAHNYAEQSGELSARNTRARLKYDFFATERLFVYMGALFEEDKFQDLDLRTALSAGPGYQFVKPGDLETECLSKMDAYGELGLSFFDEDFRRGVDNRYLAARWSFVANLPLSDTVSLFHRHEGYPGLERGDDLYVTTEQGVRLRIWEGFVATLQLNWRWDNSPSPGFERADTLYLATLGYAFDL